MDETDTSAAEPKELTPSRQVTLSSLVKTTAEVANYARQSRKEKKLYPASAVSLIGMKAAFPERFEDKSLKERDDILFFSDISTLGVAINDVVDIVPKLQEQGGQQETIEKTFRLWRKARNLVREQIKSDPEKADERNNLVRSYQREVLFIEKQCRLHSDTWSIDEVVHYRELVNAIGLIHSAAAILPPSDIGSRARPIPMREISVESIENKYGWLTRNEPTTEAERRLVTLSNLVMATQIVDDWYDIEDDRKLGIVSTGTALIDSSGSYKVAKKRMKQIRNGYLQKAIESGSTRFASAGVSRFATAVKELQRKFPKNFGGIRENLANNEAFFNETV